MVTKLKKNQIVTKQEKKTQIVPVLMVTVVTEAVVTVVIGKYFSKNNLTPQKLMKCSRCSFLRFLRCFKIFF